MEGEGVAVVAAAVGARRDTKVSDSIPLIALVNSGFQKTSATECLLCKQDVEVIGSGIRE
jgi:hypothetical protein